MCWSAELFGTAGYRCLCDAGDASLKVSQAVGDGSLLGCRDFGEAREARGAGVRRERRLCARGGLELGLCRIRKQPALHRTNHQNPRHAESQTCEHISRAEFDW